MPLPSSFVIFKDRLRRPFITIRKLYITFSKQAIEMLEYSDYVHMYIDQKNKKIAFQACAKDSLAIQFFRKSKGEKPFNFRLNGKERVVAIMEIAELDDCMEGTRFYGEYLPEDKTIVFDLTSPIHQKETKKKQ